MIEINLLPPEFRIVEKKVKKKVEYNVPKLKLIIFGVGLFVLVTGWYYLAYLKCAKKYETLNREWAILQPQSQTLTDLKGEVESILVEEKTFLTAFVATDRPLTKTLQDLSDLLPENAWLTFVRLEHSAKEETLVVQGLCVSTKTATSIESIELYLNELKKKMPKASLALTTARQYEEGVELTRFTASFTWKFDEASGSAL